MAPFRIPRIPKPRGIFTSPITVPCEECTRANRQSFEIRSCGACSKALHESELREHDLALLFEEKNESPSIQLFYDLWFVAVLSACSSLHEITNLDSLGTYLEFFALVWFTWFGTILFDVRFAIDSWFIRLSKACSVAVMALFAMTLVPFDPKNNRFGHDLQKLGLVLMSSRLILVGQYVVIMFSVWARRPGGNWAWPFIATIATSSVAAVIFVATYREDRTNSSVSIIIWLTTGLVEAVVLLLISWKWRSMSFFKTNLVERMGALTLIVMGEGIIGMTDSISHILKVLSTPSGATIGLSIAVILTCYSIWILYFDHTDTIEKPADLITKRSPRRQIWAILHFPLHIAILLTLKGCAAFMLWWVAVESLTFAPLSNLYNLGYAELPDNYPDLPGSEISNQVKLALNNITERYGGNISGSADIQGNLLEISALGSLTNETAEDSAWDLTFSIAEDVFSAICAMFGLGSSESDESNSPSTAAHRVAPSSEDIITEVLAEVEGFWFVTLFVAAGSTLMILAVLRWVGLEEGPVWPFPYKTQRGKKGLSKSLAGVAVQFLIGAALATVASLGINQNSDRFLNYIYSSWIIPTVLLTYLLVIICNNILYPTFSNVHHPPTENPDGAGRQEDIYLKVESQRPEETSRRTEMQQRPAYETYSSASALLIPHRSANDYELGERSSIRTRASSTYPDEDNYHRVEVEGGLGP